MPGTAMASPPLAYTQAVTTIDRLYLYPEQVDAPTLLFSAAEGLSDEIDWLVVNVDDDVVLLRHGDGTSLGSITVGSVDTLPHALANLEELVTESGFHTGDADLRLAILSGLTRGLDRYSRVLSGDRLSRFEVRLKGTLVGIGVTYRVQPEGAWVRSLIAEGPAAQAGLQVDDIIVRIDGVPTRNMASSDISRRIQGEEGSQVLLGVRRGENQLDVAIERAELPVPNVEHDLLEDSVGYVRIDHFSQRTVEHLRASMEALREAGGLTHGLVIDLRGNTGGSMKEAARSADQFLTEGLLLRTAGRDGDSVQNLQAEMRAVDAGDEPEIPVVVLMDRQTASGSEILAGALLAHHRVGLVGARSYGKGTVQKIYSLDDGLRLKLTVAQYLLDGDVSVAETGIQPDVAVADVVLDERGARYVRWGEDQAGRDWEDIVPSVVEREGWRGERTEERDVPLELARRAILRSYSWEREPVVAALRQVAGELRLEEDRRLVEALAARDLDWSAASQDGERPEAQVRVTAIPGEQPDTFDVTVMVTNHGSEPLHRSLVHMACDSLGYWNGLDIPVGRVLPGETGVGRLQVNMRTGYHLRQDPVTLRLRTDRRPQLDAGVAILTSQTRLRPDVATTVTLSGIGELRTAEIRVHNRSAIAVENVTVSFAAPGDSDITLVDSSAVIPLLPPGTSGSVQLGLRLTDDSPQVLPLQVRVEVDTYRRIASWKFDLNQNGEPVQLDAPELTILGGPSAPAGRHPIRVQAHDSESVDHVVLYAGDRKIAWAPGTGRGVELSVDVELQPGPNAFTAVAENTDGLRQTERFSIRGDSGAAAADAGE
ncbi:MAG: carboxyl-terminal processing protease [Myxococcota bacterium]|jgi:carboxyl-terminal processing protease